MGTPVEIEFAVDESAEGPWVFHVLQVRPVPAELVGQGAFPEEARLADAIVVSDRALGGARVHRVNDLVVVRPDLPRSKTAAAASVIEALNAELVRDGRGYCLIGPGRWGSRDPWLGIPVNWGQINGVRAIVETDFADLTVEPSYGSHFFHNMTAFGVAFLMVRGGAARVDWDRLAALPARGEWLSGMVRHLCLEHPVEVVVDGMAGRGAVLEVS